MNIFVLFCFILITSDSIPNINATKDALPVPGQFEDAIENGKGIEKGQGDASLVAPVAAENQVFIHHIFIDF